ncbi:MAG: hypothetical protein ABSE77_07220 [Acidimicrobiales bacterium]
MASLRRRSQHSVRFSHRIRPQHRLPRRQRWSRTGRRAGIGVAALAALFFPASALASSTTGPKTGSDMPAFANLKIAGLPVVTASAPAGFSAWYHRTGEPVLASLIQADTDLSKGQYTEGCSMIESVASKGLAQPYPPDPALAYHWGAALTFNITGAGECLQAQREKNSSVLRSAAGYITDAAGQIGDSASAIQALEGPNHS